LNGARGRHRIVKATTPAVGDAVGEFGQGHRLQLGDGELGQQRQASGAEEIGEGLDALPITALEKGIGLEAQFLAGQVASQVIAIARQAAHALPEVARHI